MLCHSLGGSFCERPPKMPQTDRTTTTVPTAAWNQCNLRSRCDVWGAACSPRRLETVRQELAAVRADVRCSRGFLDATTIATSQLARQSVESRQHLRKLMEEERIEGAECDSALLKGPDEERERLESLAEEVRSKSCKSQVAGFAGCSITFDHRIIYSICPCERSVSLVHRLATLPSSSSSVTRTFSTCEDSQPLSDCGSVRMLRLCKAGTSASSVIPRPRSLTRRKNKWLPCD